MNLSGKTTILCGIYGGLYRQASMYGKVCRKHKEVSSCPAVQRNQLPKYTTMHTCADTWYRYDWFDLGSFSIQILCKNISFHLIPRLCIMYYDHSYLLLKFAMIHLGSIVNYCGWPWSPSTAMLTVVVHGYWPWSFQVFIRWYCISWHISRIFRVRSWV